MSYILDALKRADADRERGHVPGLHSQTAGVAGSSSAGQQRHSQRTAWLAWVVIALLVAVAAIWWWSRLPRADPGVELAAPRMDSAPAPARPEPAPPETAPAASATVAEPAIPRPTPPVLPILAPPPAPPSTAPAAVSARPGSAATGTGAPVAAPAVAEPSAPASSTATAPVPRFADLAPELRAQLPAVSINGSTYSQNPAHRMLIANGKVVQEGGEISPGLKLETIGPRSAVLNHLGTRYSIGY
ncbi:MAG: general secretion pathway protein GspB [Hydrogenophaga sp.]|nr:general secretion pathway protein GspB [Hydrogenophaga sp.]